MVAPEVTTIKMCFILVFQFQHARDGMPIDDVGKPLGQSSEGKGLQCISAIEFDVDQIDQEVV